MRGLTKFLLWFCGIFGVIGAILYYTMFDVWTVPADDAALNVSMAPNVAGGDLLLVSRTGTPKEGDLLRCDDPDSPGRFVVARMIGSPNDKVEFVNDAVRVNEKRSPSPRGCGKVRLVHPTTGQEIEYDCHEEEYAGANFNIVNKPEASTRPTSAVVPGGKIFLVSDNRTTHVDSRDYGAVDPDSCKPLVGRIVSAEGWFDAPHRMTIL